MTRTVYLLVRIGEDGNSTADKYAADRLRECMAAYVHDRAGLLSATVFATRNGYVDAIAHWERIDLRAEPQLWGDADPR